MKRYFYIKKDTKQISMVAEGKLEVDKEKYEEVIKTITEAEWQQIDTAEKSFIKDGEFVIIPRIDQQAEKKKAIAELKAKIENNQMTNKEALKAILDINNNFNITE